MNEKQLYYLTVIAACGSIQPASRKLKKTPSTLTRMLKKLESDIGTPVFRRTSEGLVPTAAGERMLTDARNILDRLQELKTLTGTARPDDMDAEAMKIHGASTSGVLHEWTENEIRYLLVIREHKNISRAAQELFLAQPSLSEMVHELENAFGQEIFVRVKYGVEETAFGTELLNRLSAIRDCYDRMRLEIDEFQEMKKGVLTFGVPMNLGTYVLPLVLPEFCRRYPGITVRVRENNTSELEKLMIARKIDFCIMHDYEQSEQVEYRTFFDDPFYLVVPGSMKNELKIPAEKKLTADDLRCLSETPFVMVAPRQKLRLVADRILECAGITPHIRCTSRSMETCKRLVAAGMGVTFLPRTYLTLYSGTEGLESYPIDESLNGSWKLMAAYLRRGGLSGASREFLRMLKECLETADQQG